MVIEKILPVIILFILGFILKRRQILKKEDSKVFSHLLLNIVVPAVIINALWTANLDMNLIYIPISSLLVLISLLVIGVAFSSLMNLKGDIKKTSIMAFATLEIGSIGYAFMLAVFGMEGLSRIVLFDSVNILFLFTVIYMISGMGKGKNNLIANITKLVKTPVVWAIIMGISMNIIGFQNEFVSGFLGTISGATLLLITMIVGIEFEPKLSSLKLPAITLITKTAFGIALGFGFSYLFGLGGLDRIAVIVGSSLPPSICTLIFSKENNLDSKFLANTVSIGLVLGVVVVSILIGFI